MAKPPPQKDLSKARTVTDIIAPQHLEIDFNHVQIGHSYFRSYFTTINRRFVDSNWLNPLINFDHSMRISMFIYPVESKSTLDDLRRKIAEMEAELATDIQRGKIVDPSTSAKLEDALSLQDMLVKGIERFFQYSMYITIPAESVPALDTISKQITSTLGSLLLGAIPLALEQGQGFRSTLPLCSDYSMITRNMDTTSLATTFPFTSSELTSNEGIMYGINEHNGSLIIFDRFSMENANAVVFAKAGAGKSTHSKEKVLIKDSSGTKITNIGPYIESLFNKNTVKQIDSEIEGVIPDNVSVWTFNTKTLQNEWSSVTVAARKKFSPRNKLYKFTTKSGRSLIVTADHNMLIMRNGKIRIMRSQAAKIGESVPLARNLNIASSNSLSPELLTLLGLITSEGHTTPQTTEIYNTDPTVLKIIKQCASKLGYTVTPRYNYPQREIRGYYVGKNSFAKYCYSLGACGLSGDKRIPPIVFSLPKEQSSQYLKSYYEGDGGVENHEVTVTTKSPDLASDLLYLLLSFGIVARMRPRKMSARNTVNKTVRTYYRVSISGKGNLQKFADQIGFLTPTKNNKLKSLLASLPKFNTNVDTVPGLSSTFNYLYKSLYPTTEIKAPQIIIDIKNGEYNPSREQLLQSIALMESRIASLKSLQNNISLLKNLPSLSSLIRSGSQKPYNQKLWDILGQSWRTMKKYLNPPFTHNVLLAYNTISGQKWSTAQVSSALYESFKEQGVSLQNYDKSLWTATVLRNSKNSHYSTIFKAARFIVRKYKSTQTLLRHCQQKLNELKLFAQSDLFWDPIISIESVKHKEKYVYDLQVDNGVFLAGEGGMFVHNSYMVKLELLRSLMFGVEIIAIDPENEYKTLCDAVGGDYINFAFNSQNRINPFDLSTVTEYSEENELNSKIQSLHSLFKVIMGDMNPTEEALLDRALNLMYKLKGINTDPATQKRTPPLMEDLYKALIGMEETMAQGLADRVEKFVKGSFQGVIDQPSNVQLKNPFTVFSVRDLDDSLKPIAIFIILDYIWTKMRRDLKKRLLVVDEAWYLMKYPASADFLFSIAKRARKYFLGLTTITQDVEDFLNTDHGKAIVTNSSIQILMKQSPAAIDRLGAAFYLSEGEKHLLLSANVGEGLFFAGNNHVAARFVASPEEHKLITTKPQDILKMKQEEKLLSENVQNSKSNDQ